MTIKKINIVIAVGIVVIAGTLIRNSNFSKNREESGSNPEINLILRDLSKYITGINVSGEKIVIVLHNSEVVDSKGKPLDFLERTIERTLKEKLVANNFTVVNVQVPCTTEAECINELYEAGIGIRNLEPEAIIYTSPVSGVNTEVFNQILNSSNIDIYVYKTDSLLNYKLYVGPDNLGLGTKAAEYILSQSNPSRNSVLYIESFEDITKNSLDNAYPRINTARQLLEQKGYQTVDTLYTSWRENETYDKVKALLTSNPDVDYIITPSSETARGAATAVKELNLQSKIDIISLDFNELVKDMILQRDIKAAVGQDIIKQATVIAESIIEEKDYYETKLLFHSDVITIENIENFRDNKGYIY